MSKSVNVSLTPEQVDFLRGVMFEFFQKYDADAETEALRAEVEDVLAAAEDEIYQVNQ